VQRSELDVEARGASNVRPAYGGLADLARCAAWRRALVVNREAAITIVVAIAKDLTKERGGRLATENDDPTSRFGVRRGVFR
jgi:hypothetical protein